MIAKLHVTMGVGSAKTFGVNWATWLSGATISTSAWAARGGVSVSSPASDDTSVSVKITADRTGRRFEAINTITTSDGQTERAAVMVDVLERLELDGPMVREGGSIVLVVGDDYLDADGRALTVESNSWPDLTGATIAMSLLRLADETEDAVEIEGEVVTATATAPALARVRFDLPTAKTSLLSPDGRGAYLCDVQATLSGGGKVTLYRDTVAAVRQVTA